ncbi:hypothetical protein, partial [Mucilaginibacter sp. 10I4]|uniref:hypothetical protein n=1 Tax=Mucilaginibacter sp. 10I4 TaxID=3048580 RepID=UPI002B224754
MSTTSRFPTNTLGSFFKRENTFAALAGDFQTPAFAATIALVIGAQMAKTIIAPVVLTGSVTFTANVDTPLIGDRIEFLLTPDGTTRVVTFGTGFASTGPLSVTTGKYASAQFVFNGTIW